MIFNILPKITRLPFITVTLLPVLYSSSYAYKIGLNITLYKVFLLLLGTVFAHLGANLLNDYADRDRIDIYNKNFSQFNGGSVHQIGKDISLKTYLRLSVIFFFLAAACGLILLINAPKIAIVPFLGGALCGILYSQHPLSFQSRGLGEILIFAAFGPLLTWGCGIILENSPSYNYLILGIPFGILTTCIIVINEFPDYECDKERGKHNLIVKLGKKNGYIFLVSLYFAFIIFNAIASTYGIYNNIYLLLQVAFIFIIIIFSFKFYKHFNDRNIENYQKFAIFFHLLTGIILITLEIVKI